MRTFLDDHGNLWFCTKDVCEVLGYTNYKIIAVKRGHRNDTPLPKGANKCLPSSIKATSTA
ncbi:BRO-N domain-containing protein [Nitrosomonas communis]|uniref:BRO-N domain-containing protein n=1 Tax=Nitrosomonas communis TaxID=44574 RepID=UPI0035286BA9